MGQGDPFDSGAIVALAVMCAIASGIELVVSIRDVPELLTSGSTTYYYVASAVGLVCAVAAGALRHRDFLAGVALCLSGLTAVSWLVFGALAGS